MAESIIWETIVSQPFVQNSYVVRRYGARECFILDPGFEPELIERFIDSANLVPIAILNTHGHSDHIAGNAAMKQRWPDIPLIIGEREAEKLLDPNKNLSAGYGAAIVSPPADRTVREGDKLDLDGIQWDVLETPGHSPGHVVYVYEHQSPVVILGGDVLFQGSIGRSDFPDGNHNDLVSSIREKLFKYSDETIVLTGHGPETTIGAEKRLNPFVGEGVG